MSNGDSYEKQQGFLKPGERAPSLTDKFMDSRLGSAFISGVGTLGLATYVFLPERGKEWVNNVANKLDLD